MKLLLEAIETNWEYCLSCCNEDANCQLNDEATLYVSANWKYPHMIQIGYFCKGGRNMELLVEATEMSWENCLSCCQEDANC